MNLFLRCYIRYFGVPYDDSKFQLVARNKKYTFLMPTDRKMRYEWNEALIEILDKNDQYLKQASGDNRMFTHPAQWYSIALTKTEVESLVKRFSKWSARSYEGPDWDNMTANQKYQL